MKIKNLVLVSIFIFMAMLCYEIMPVLGQEDYDTAEIKTVINNFLFSFANQDFDSVVSYLSPNYHDVGQRGGANIDYTEFKARTKQYMDEFFRKTADFSIIDVKFIKIDVHDNKASVEAELIGKGFNLDLLIEETVTQKRSFLLAKEEGVWKITTSRWTILSRQASSN